MKSLAILGSTGSIGTQTLEIVRQNPEDFCVRSLACKSNITLLERQIREFHPVLAAVGTKEDADDLAVRVADQNIRIVYGMDGLIEAARVEGADTVVTAIVGMIGILPTIEAIKAGRDIALANKETLVTAGHLIMPMAKEYGVSILPVDSEHSAIFQCLQGEEHGCIEKILLTASGGPFRGKTREELVRMRPEDALRHPNWAMGNKITIDSASMANKGLEVMEVRWLYDVPLDDIQVVIQPQSIIHSMVQFHDGAVMAQLGVPDMKLPIAYALYYPHRHHLGGERLDWTTLKGLTFETPDLETFPALKLAMNACRAGGSMPTVFNASNERAVQLFLNREIGFTQIDEIIAWCMEQHRNIQNPSVEQILAVEQSVYDRIESGWKKR